MPNEPTAASRLSLRDAIPAHSDGGRNGTAHSQLTGLYRPTADDGADVHRLIATCKPLDLNSTYAYLLLCHHYADTCVIARAQGCISGFISGYVPPQARKTLFIWQVAVHPDARGAHLGVRMLTHLLMRKSLAETRFMETTVSPSNVASRRMFQRFADDIVAPITEQLLFDRAAFGGEAHEDEMLLKIGPFETGATRRETL